MQQAPIQRMNPEHYLSLEGRQHGVHTYPPISIALHKLACTPEIENKGAQLGLTLKNTALELDGTLYLGDITNQQSINLLNALKGTFPNPRIFVNFLKASYERELKQVWG